jgi:hypothetical protein
VEGYGQVLSASRQSKSRQACHWSMVSLRIAVAESFGVAVLYLCPEVGIVQGLRREGIDGVMRGEEVVR